MINTNIKVLAVIPARGGSKGLPRKNIANLAGKPLIAWTIEASLNSKYITKTIVSSEDEEILSVSKKYGAEVIQRPEYLASDNATSESVVKHVVDFLQSDAEEFDVIALLQPTSPLRGYSDIDKAFDKLLFEGATALISVFEPEHSPLKSFKIEESGYLKGIVNNEYPFTSRQLLPKTYQSNGAIYIINLECFLDSMTFFTEKTIPYFMPIKESIDIDTKRDLENIEKIMRNT